MYTFEQTQRDKLKCVSKDNKHINIYISSRCYIKDMVFRKIYIFVINYTIFIIK